MNVQPINPEVSVPESQPSRSTAAHDFFDRPAPPGYLEEWSKRLASDEDETFRNLATLMIFRLHGEYLALPIGVLVEVTAPQPVHAVPHRSNRVLQGLVNIRGQLRLYVSLHGLLGIDLPASGVDQNAKTTRLVVLQQRAEAWVFPVEEVLAVGRIDIDAQRAVPATLGRSSSATAAVFAWKGHTVGLLDCERMLAMLRSACS